jgi:cytochrome P450
MFDVDIHQLHHNPDEWREPSKFIPERFDPSSPYFLTPGGSKRHPMSFGPFLGGRRVCVGKTLAEVVSRIVGPALLYSYDFAFVDKTHYHYKPSNHALMVNTPIIMVKVTKANYSKAT